MSCPSCHFLIDQNHQKRGYGESALRQIIAELSEKPDGAAGGQDPGAGQQRADRHPLDL